MATYGLVHGAGSSSWYWHLVVPQLRGLGHDVVAVDLPCDDESAGLQDYADAIVDAVGDRTEVILVAQSLAGFSAPLVCGRLPVRQLILVAAMVPLPGESAGQWWGNTGHEFPDPLDPAVVFAHDLSPALAAESLLHLRDQAARPFEEPWPLESWPDVPTRFLLRAADRFFRRHFSAGSFASGSVSSPTRSPVVTCPRSPVPRSWSDGWSTTAARRGDEPGRRVALACSARSGERGRQTTRQASGRALLTGSGHSSCPYTRTRAQHSTPIRQLGAAAPQNGW